MSDDVYGYDLRRDEERFGDHVHSKASFGVCKPVTEKEIEESWTKQRATYIDWFKWRKLPLSEAALDDMKWHHTQMMRKRGW